MSILLGTFPGRRQGEVDRVDGKGEVGRGGLPSGSRTGMVWPCGHCGLVCGFSVQRDRRGVRKLHLARCTEWLLSALIMVTYFSNPEHQLTDDEVLFIL